MDTAYFTPAVCGPEVRARLGWGDRPVVLTVGRLQKPKGQDMMIRALARIRRSVPNVLYAIVGDGEERPSLRTLFRPRGRRNTFCFMGRTTCAGRDCYRACDLFALPNRQEGRDIEGFGMVLLEAQACGKPVIAGRMGARRRRWPFLPRAESSLVMLPNSLRIWLPNFWRIARRGTHGQGRSRLGGVSLRLVGCQPSGRTGI